MTEILWIRSHVERLLQDQWDQCQVAVDDDGDYPFCHGTAACWVRVMDSDPVMVRVFAHAAMGIRPSMKVLHELNEIQSRLLSATVALQGDLVVVHQTISPVGLTQPVLAQALHSVGGVADDIGLLLASMFNGATPFPAEDSESQDAA
ncbi:MAG: YbjN domain-containing protein [Jatrophihabitantaceae bacterium]